MLIQVLTETLPPFLQHNLDSPGSKPVRLVVIDALAELFHSSEKTTTQTLVERSQNVTEISALLHKLASKWNIAILVLNEVIDTFEHGRARNNPEELEYGDQARWFGRGHSVPGEDRKEASLGLVWANQVNVRILLSRTGRRRYMDSKEVISSKRQKLDSHSGPVIKQDLLMDDSQPALIRRLNIIFSSVCSPSSFDYVVTRAGISILPSTTEPSTPQCAPPIPAPDSVEATREHEQMAPMDVGFAQDMNNATEIPSSQEDEWESFWTSDALPDP